MFDFAVDLGSYSQHSYGSSWLSGILVSGDLTPHTEIHQVRTPMYVRQKYIYFKKKKANNVENIRESMTEEYIDNIEKKSMAANINEDATKYEEIIEEIEVMENKEDKANTLNTDEEVIETLDDAKIDVTIKSLDNLDTLEEKSIIREKNDDGIDKNEYKDFEGVQSSNEAIAFGGEERKEKVYSTQSKKDELKCSRCGSSLVGSNGFCPGCGAKI